MNVKVVGVWDLTEEELGQAFHALGYPSAKARARWAKALCWQYKTSTPDQLAVILERFGLCDDRQDTLTFARVLFEIEGKNLYGEAPI